MSWVSSKESKTWNWKTTLISTGNTLLKLCETRSQQDLKQWQTHWSHTGGAEATQSTELYSSAPPCCFAYQARKKHKSIFGSPPAEEQTSCRPSASQSDGCEKEVKGWSGLMGGWVEQPPSVPLDLSSPDSPWKSIPVSGGSFPPACVRNARVTCAERSPWLTRLCSPPLFRVLRRAFIIQGAGLAGATSN